MTATTTCQKIRDLAPGFVLGALEPDEMALVRNHLADCDKPHPEIRELGGVVPYLAQLVEPVEPPAALKSSILSAVRADIAASERRDQAAERLVAAFGTPGTGRARSRRAAAEPAETTAEVTAPVPASAAQPLAGPAAEPSPAARPASAGVTSIDEARSRRWRAARWLAAAAAVLAIVVSTAWAVSLQQQVNGMKEQIAARASIYRGGPQDKAVITLTSPTGDQANGLGRVRANGHLFLLLFDLPETTGGDVYVVWLVPDSGVPVRAAVIDQPNGGWAQVDLDSPVVGAANVVLVTREHSRDVAQPSTPPILSGQLN